MSSIIKAINNFGITIYNGEIYFQGDYNVKKVKNIEFKYKIHKEQLFTGDMKAMTIEYVRNILKNEELFTYLIDKIRTDYIKLNVNNSIINLDSELVYLYLINKYYDELQKQNTDIIKVNQKNIEKDKKKKKNITQLMKRRVWAKHIGEDIGKAKCLCCNMSDITQLTFNCGHIISEANGGETSVENLLPICQSCNSSMGTQNLYEYKKAHGL